jgi:hypothetical protein
VYVFMAVCYPSPASVKHDDLTAGREGSWLDIHPLLALISAGAGLILHSARSFPTLLPLARLVDLLPGVSFAAVGWVALQTIGLRLVTHQLRRKSQLYGAIGAALGLIAFFLLATQVILYGLEVAVVRAQRLWPRSLLQPPLTGPDRQMLITMAKQEERRPEERISVEIDSTTSQV